MPSVSKSKTKSNNRKTTSGGAVKEQMKDSEKSTTGTFHRPENAVDDSDAHSGSGSSGTGLEYDMVSNNGSSNSGESEDLKEKTVSNIVDFEKREKIRLRNEKKHQHQRERRAQELHERCCSLLMSRKVESLSWQLIAMGFTSEQATAALRMNDGQLEESVSWLLEGNNTVADKKDGNLSNEAGLKIDITEELAQVEAMETRYNCSKKEVERAVVACEGDLQKAEEMVVHRQKQEMLLSPSRSEETNDVNAVLPLEKPDSNSIQQRNSGRDVNYPNGVHGGSTLSESVGKYQQLQRESRVNGVSDRLWQPLVSNLPRNTFSSSASVLVRHSANVVDARLSNTGYVGNNNVQQTAVREPIIVMQRPQSSSMKHILQPTSGRVAHHHDRTLSGLRASDVHPQQSLYQASYRHQDAASNLTDTSRMQLGNFGSRNQMPPSPTLNVPSSLGLFSIRSNGHSSSSSHVDWNHLAWYSQGQMPLCDYNSIDWTMDSSSHLGLSSTWKNGSSRNEGGAVSGFSEWLMAGQDMPVGSHEWTSPFAGKDIFSAPRQFVNSSSLW